MRGDACGETQSPTGAMVAAGPNAGLVQELAMRRGLLAVAVAVAMAAGTIAVAGAADWPAKPVRIVSPFAPGGTSDTLARLLAEQLTDKFGQNFFVEISGLICA